MLSYFDLFSWLLLLGLDFYRPTLHKVVCPSHVSSPRALEMLNFVVVALSCPPPVERALGWFVVQKKQSECFSMLTKQR